MDAETKKGLKDAKEFVKNKDFTAALEACKVYIKFHFFFKCFGNFLI